MAVGLGEPRDLRLLTSPSPDHAFSGKEGTSLSPLAMATVRLSQAASVLCVGSPMVLVLPVLSQEKDTQGGPWISNARNLQLHSEHWLR